MTSSLDGSPTASSTTAAASRFSAGGTASRSSVSTWVGFEDDEAEDGERRASTNWPIQKYQWTDYMADPGDTLQYRMLPMVGPDKSNLQPESERRRASGPTKIFLSP